MPNFYNIIRAKKFSTTADTAVEIGPSTSATPNFAIDAGGKLNWSSGSATADTNLYRSTPNYLKTDDSFEVALNLTVGGTTVLQQSKEKFTVDSVSAISSTATNVYVLDGAVYYTLEQLLMVLNLISQETLQALL
jgi:hypothetical protein